MEMFTIQSIHYMESLLYLSCSMSPSMHVVFVARLKSKMDRSAISETVLESLFNASQHQSIQCTTSLYQQYYSSSSSIMRSIIIPSSNCQTKTKASALFIKSPRFVCRTFLIKANYMTMRFRQDCERCISLTFNFLTSSIAFSRSSLYLRSFSSQVASRRTLRCAAEKETHHVVEQSNVDSPELHQSSLDGVTVKCVQIHLERSLKVCL